MHHLWARAHLTVLEIRFFGAVVVASIILFRLVITVAKIRFSEQKTKIFLSFFEREYLRGKASEIVLFRENSKIFPQNFISVPPCILLPSLNREGQGEGLISVCLSMSKIAFEALASKIACHRVPVPVCARERG